MRRTMRNTFKRVIAAACAASMVLTGMFSDIGTVTAKAAGEHTLWIVGDSTVSAFTDSYYYPRYGYGTQIDNYVDDTYTIQNLAKSGTSSKSFTSEANYTTLTSGIQAGDTLVIGFGHNDEKTDARYTSPIGDYTTEGSFAKSLYDNYVKMAQDKGAEVILCTPIVRRTKSGEWSDSELHVTNGGDYAQVIRDLGSTLNVPVVDLTAQTKALYDELGVSETLYLHAWTSNKENTVDNTHLNIYGAKKVAWLFANAVDDTTATLASHIDLTAGEPTKAVDLVSNPDYEPPVYDGELAQSELFDDYVIEEGTGDGDDVAFKGTAFGDIAGDPSTANHTLETDERGNMHVAVANGKGKISSNTDGIGMYYYKVPATSTFSLSAKMTVNSYVAESQVAFGLMARDDMYIDEYVAALASDYVVAGTRGNGVNCFYRKDGSIGGQASLTTEELAAGSSYNVSIVSNSDGYACTFGNEPTQSAGYDFALTSVDSEYVYVGMFAARNADVTFSNIHLVVDGETIADTRKTEYTVTVSDDGNGTGKANAVSAAAGDTVKLTATPNAGYYFKEWKVVSGDVTIEDDSFVMPAENVEVQAVFEAYRTSWDFQNDTSLFGENGVKYEGDAAVVAGLEVDATGGKWDSTGTNGWVQVNAGTKIVIPVEDSCKVSLVMYDANYTVDGVAATSATETFTCEGTDNQVVLETTANTYLRSINVAKFAYAEAGVVDMTPESASLDSCRGFGFTGFEDINNSHGFRSTTADATMVIELSEKANVIVTSCCFGAGADGTMTASSGTVTKTTAVEGTGGDAPTFTVMGASAGTLTLTFAADMYVHNVMVEYVKDVGNRKIDVWDLGGKVETNTEMYTNNITPADWIAKGISKSFPAGTTEFGDLTLNHTASERFYSTVDALKDRSYGTFTAATNAYSDGYTAAGGFYVGGSGGESRRYWTLANVQAGDKVIVYGGIHGGSDTIFHFDGMGTASAQKETVANASAQYQKMVFVADYTGTYKFWEDNKGKAFYHRVVRVPGVKVSGTISAADVDGKYTGTEHSVKFVNQTTKKETMAVLDGDNFTATLAPGYSYTAVLVGATGFGFSTETRIVETTDAEALTGKSGVELVIEPKETYTYSGKITGFAEGYDVSKLAVTMVPPADTTALEVPVTIDADLNFTATLEPDVEYTIQLAGVNDYEVTSELVITNDEDYQADITVALKAMYAATGKFFGLGEGVTVTALNFENVEDGYVYAATVADNGFSLNLRDGAYQAKATVDGYSTMTHIVVDGAAASKDLMFVSTAAAPAVAWASDIYVGYADKANNYATVSEAVAAVAAMNPTSEAQRVTIHIAPGTYREQVVVSAPYVSFVNDTDEEVLITGYYGIGYQYYSLDANGYYNPEYAYDQFEKNGPADWGCTVYVKPSATAFRAEGITFENSFNRYITDEELEDGVEPSGAESIDVVRKYGVDVQSKDATERAAAMVVKADKVEFKNCTFLSSQDTLLTGNAAYDVYFKNCFIEGQTDYIFGDGNAIFDACELSFKGYSGKSAGGYITAAKLSSSAKGYLFRNCVVTANKDLEVTSGYFGRPWGANAQVMFLNTRLESTDLIDAAGWYKMACEPQDAYFYEWNTTDMNGNAVDTSSRKSKTTTAEIAATWTMESYFGDWVPAFYEAEDATVAFATAPFITDNGDINTPYPGHKLTVGYSLGEANDANDASRIEWYRVKAGAEDVLVKTSAANVDKTYKITSDDIGYQIKVVVTPMTVSGNTGEAASYTVPEAVRDGYEDPDATGPGAVLGDGVNVFLVGDSTVKDYSAKGLTTGGTARNEGAWGEFFQGFFDDETVTVVNYANGGRSTRNFINEGSLDTVASQIGEGDYLFIQFGHNDCSNGAGYLADRFVPLGEPDANGVYPVTAGVKVDTPAELANMKYGPQCYTWDCGGTFKWYLLQYINVAREAGATPVLVTPVSRMYFNADGTIKPHHDSTDKTTGTQVTSNNAYVTAVEQLAKEQNVLLVDGFGLTKDLFEDSYAACGSNTYGSQIMHTGDSTHNNKLGGVIEAAAIASTVQNMGLDISYAVKTPSQMLGETTTGQTVFSISGSGVLTAYDINSEYAERAPYWEGVGQEMIDAIGAKAKELAGQGGGSNPKPPVNNEGLKVVLADPAAEYIYTGSAIKPAIIVTNNGEELTAGVDYTVKYSNNTAVSTAKKIAKITVTGKGNLTGSASTTFVIEAKNLADNDIVEGAVIVAKNSKATPVLYYNGKKLGAKDFTNADAKTKYTEDGVMKLTGKGNFTGEREVPVKVVDKSALNKFNVKVDTKAVLTYDGNDKTEAIYAAVTVTDKKDKNKILTLDEDYFIDFGTSSTVNAGTVKFTVIGMNEYTGTVAKSIKIKPVAVKEGITYDAEAIDAAGYTFVSSGVKIDEDIVVKYGDVELVQGKDYKVTYSNNKKVSTAKSQAKFTISFLGNYKGSKALKGTFKINPQPLSGEMDGIKIVSADKVYTKKNVYKSAPIVTIDGVTLKSSNYTVKYYLDASMSDETEMTSKNKLELTGDQTFATVYVKITGKGNYAPVNGEYATTQYTVSKKDAEAVDLSKARVTFVDAEGKKLTKVEYTGNELEPQVKVEVKVKVGKKTEWQVVEDANYEVTYMNNVKKGTATAVINATGEGYVGSKTAKFTVAAKNLKGIGDLLGDLFG